MTFNYARVNSRIMNIVQCRSILGGLNNLHLPLKRCLSFNGWSKDTNSTMTKVETDAERIVGFPTSFLSLRALLSDELSAVALHLRKLVRTKHPLLKTARGILFDSKHNVQTRGLIVLLFAKSIAQHKSASLNLNEIYNSQRTLAELTELIHTAFLVHRGLTGVDTLMKQDSNNSRSEMELGNKMAVLSGDFLLANACVALSELRNSKVVNMMSSSIADMSHGFFILPESGDSPDPTSLSILPTSRKDWEDAIFLSQGSLISNACLSAVELANQNGEFAECASSFGKNLILAQQARADMQRITCINNNTNNNGNFNHYSTELSALPVVLLANKHGGSDWLKNFVYVDDVTNMSLVMKQKLSSEVSKQNSVLEECEEICRHHRDSALSALNVLPPGEARESLKLLTKTFTAS
nr:decaprenyl-diphosphate synthase subunit 2-like [Ciona intestinalis]|eukprot:XP_026695230.1 decaprenyl-diphosphate synthase subunit 2-like [Ciona intestinalis]